MDEEAYGHLDEAMLRPPQILGCERAPFLLVLGASAFLSITVFGITFPSLVAAVMLAFAGVMVLRRIAAHDPFWFAVLFESARYPRHLPDVLPDPALPRDLAFVGYDDPPSRAAVLLAWIAAVAGVVLPAAAAWVLFGLVPALCTLVVIPVAMALVLVPRVPPARAR